MNDKFISSLHIQKLGHEIQEIRQRALYNIKSKLDHGFVFDNDLARSKEFLTKLFDWFLFTPCTNQDLVLSLIKQTLSSETGGVLISHFGANTFKQELNKIRTYIEPKYYLLLDEIVQILNQHAVIVPPLETDIPLSYRTGQSEFPSTRRVETTATTIEGLIQGDSSTGQQNTPQSTPSSRSSGVCMVAPLKWQYLIEADRQVLQSIENSLRNAPQPASLLHSANFLADVLLHDFPAEVFLQRPSIISSFYDIVANCQSTRVVNSVLNCLNQLTKLLQVRIHCSKDPCLFSCKENNHFVATYRTGTPDSVSAKTTPNDSERPENVDYLKTAQISFPRYCYLTFKCVFKYLCVKPETINLDNYKPNQRGVNLALTLLNELLQLLALVASSDIWTNTTTPEIAEIRKEMSDVLIGCGSTMDHFRVEATSNDSNATTRVTYLCFMYGCANLLSKLVPLSQTGLVLPRNLKNALANSLVDVTLAKLYPDVYQTLLEYVQSCKAGLDDESLLKYNETNKICTSMSAAVEFMKRCKTMNACDAVDLAERALQSLEFHGDLAFVQDVIGLGTDKLPLYPNDDNLMDKFERVILGLLGHSLEEVREETYTLCQKRIVSAIGPRYNSSCVSSNQVLFLCRPKVLVEIACHGLTSENTQIRNQAEDILIHLIKCKILVSDDVWNKILQALIASLPILLCHAGRDTVLGRSLLDFIDPDTAQTLGLPRDEVIKGNVIVLFGRDNRAREEAFSRLSWLLASQKDARDMLPRLNNLHDKALPNICQNQRLLDVNKRRTNEHFYQPSSLQQVLDLLKSPNVEPVIRRSALTQISVMTEDPILHATFLGNDGIEVVLGVIRSALIDKNYKDYPDSVIPAVGILKNVCLSTAGARQALRTNMEVYCNVLRSVFMFFVEDKAKHDCVCLLFLLIFHEFIRGSPAKANVSIPCLLKEKLQVPFVCNTHWDVSPYADASVFDLITSDRWCLSSIQIQWNLEMYGGLDELLTWDKIDYSGSGVAEILRLRSYDLITLKASSTDYYIRKYLKDVQNGTTHENVIDSINKLTSYVLLCKATPDQEILQHCWESTFTRFLKNLPSSEDDAKLLTSVLKFLKHLVPFYKSSDGSFWLSDLLKSPSNCVLDLIIVEPSALDDFKTLSRDLLSLITVCASQEQHFLDYYTPACPKHSAPIKSWSSVIGIIVKCLKFNVSTHFYNLSYLNSLLACLVHLTASLGWTDSKLGAVPKPILSTLISRLCELIVVFNSGKGPTATTSVMGLSITRHVILILNHILAEMHSFKLKSWDKCFVDAEDDWMKSFLALWSSRDVLLRAGVLQLFAGLAMSPILAINMTNDVRDDNRSVWQLSLALLIDHDEASIVRENSAYLFANLLGHTVHHSGKSVIVASLLPKSLKQGENNANDVIFDLLEDFEFYKHLVVALSRLYTLNSSTSSVANLLEYNTPNCDNSSSSGESHVATSLVTPSFVKSVTNLLLALLNLNEERLCCKLQEFGLVKLLFRCLSNDFSVTLADTRQMSLYCELLEMNIAICVLLGQLVQTSNVCLGTVLHIKDCLTTAISLLNPNLFNTDLPQLIYLRNQLWNEIFRLVSVCIGRTDEAVSVLTQTIDEESPRAFLDTVCEATAGLTFNDLQTSALLSLTSLLSVGSMQNLLDSSRIRSDSIAGASICKILLNLYDVCTLKVTKDVHRKKSVVVASLTSILCVSREAKRFAFNHGLVEHNVKQLKEIHMKLGLESLDCLRRVLEKKRVCPMLKDLDELLGLVTNFMVGDEEVKNKFAECGLSDLVHKLWVWCALQNPLLVDALKLLCTFTTDCVCACQTLPLTSSVAGSGPRKVPSKISLLHAVINLIDREMEQVSRTHSLEMLELCFVVLKNCCAVLECRILLCKTTLLNSTTRLHPAITKKQKPWDAVELLWLDFLQTFSLFPEGQSSIAKMNEVLDLVVTLGNSKSPNNTTAMMVLRNIAFYQPNRTRLLTSDEFLHLLKNKLENGNHQDKIIVVLIMWSLAANNQKAKNVFKAAELDKQLQQILKHYQISTEFIPDDDVQTVKYVLSVIRDNDREL